MVWWWSLSFFLQKKNNTPLKQRLRTLCNIHRFVLLIVSPITRYKKLKSCNQQSNKLKGVITVLSIISIKCLSNKHTHKKYHQLNTNIQVKTASNEDDKFIGVWPSPCVLLFSLEFEYTKKNNIMHNTTLLRDKQFLGFLIWFFLNAL